MVDGQSAHHLTESSLRECIRFRIVGSGEMSEGDICEGASQQESFMFPALDVNGMEIARTINPVNDYFRVAYDL
jgi:hypothetical protein